MNRASGIATVGALLLAAALPDAAQGQPCDRTTVYVSAFDPAGFPLLDLQAEQLTAKFKGRAVKVVSVKRDLRPKRLLIFLDASRSMTAQQRMWNLALRVVEGFVNAADAKERVSLILFGKTIEARVDANGKSAEIKDLMVQIASGSKVFRGQRLTAVYDTIHGEIAKTRDPAVRDVVLVITDGVDDASRMQGHEFENFLVENQTVLSAVVMSQAYGTLGRTPEELAGPREMASAVASSGGLQARLYNWTDRDREAFLKDVNRIGGTMNVSYVVELELDSAVGKGGKWELGFVNQPKEPALRKLLVYPQRLRGCAGK